MWYPFDHLVRHGRGPVPGVGVEDPAARPPGHPHHDVRAVHRVHRALRSVLAAAAVARLGLGFSLRFGLGLRLWSVNSIAFHNSSRMTLIKLEIFAERFESQQKELWIHNKLLKR